MKDLLVTIIQSVFKYIINPTIWSRVAADVTSSSSTEGNTERIQRVEMTTGPDLRDVNVGKALDLATQHIQLIIETKKAELSQIQPSGVELLALSAEAASIAPVLSAMSTASSLMSSASSSSFTTEKPKNVTNLNAEQQQQQQKQKIEKDDDEHRLSGASTESYEEIGSDDILLLQNSSVISINDTQPSSEISTTTTTTASTSVSTSTSTSTEYISSLKSSDNSGFSFTSQSRKSSCDSVEILSLSSDAASSSSSAANEDF